MAPPEIIGMGEEIKDWHEVKRNGSKMIFLFPDTVLPVHNPVPPPHMMISRKGPRD